MADCSFCGDYPEGSACTYAACPGRKFHKLRAIPGAQTGEVVQAASPDWFKIADWPSHERPDIWTWGDGVRLAESARAELGSSFLHGGPYAGK